MNRARVVGINTFIKLDDASYRQSSIAIVGSSITAYLREIGIGSPRPRQRLPPLRHKTKRPMARKG